MELPAEALELILPRDKPVTVQLPRYEQPTEVGSGDAREFRFPAKSAVTEPPVDRWRLAQVIAYSVAGICLWGTIVGSMLPFAFRWMGADPGIASSPFVATFVDVTGIIIYFSIAKIFLL